MFRRTLLMFVCAALLLALFTVTAHAQADPLFDVNAKAALLLDPATGTVLYEKNADQPLPIASVNKIMTLLLCMEALDDGRITLTDTVLASQEAMDMGGSQAYIEANGEYMVGELLKAIIVASANDACVAMAELLAGSEEAFVHQMNERAQALGMTSAHFVNCSGLPAQGQEMSARDVSIMASHLITHPIFFQYSTIWMYEMEHPAGRTTALSNTNKLIRQLEGVDGIKTGSTNEAGYCMAATARRSDSRFIAVVLGSATSKDRFDAAAKLLNYAFSGYRTLLLYEGGAVIEEEIDVAGSAQGKVRALAPQNVSVLIRKGEEGQITTQVEILPELSAPVEKNAVIGKLTIYKDETPLAEYPLVADRSLRSAGFWDYLQRIASFMR